MDSKAPFQTRLRFSCEHKQSSTSCSALTANNCSLLGQMAFLLIPKSDMEKIFLYFLFKRIFQSCYLTFLILEFLIYMHTCASSGCKLYSLVEMNFNRLYSIWIWNYNTVNPGKCTRKSDWTQIYLNQSSFEFKPSEMHWWDAGEVSIWSIHKLSTMSNIH